MGDYTDNKQPAYHCKMIVYINANRHPGETVKAKSYSRWLKTVEVKTSIAASTSQNDDIFYTKKRLKRPIFVRTLLTSRYETIFGFTTACL